MKKELNNKGFSLVELIIVIAIMAVLMGVLAPQYLKYVAQSKVSTDITNAEEIATAINVTVADSANANADQLAFSSSPATVNAGDVIVNKSSGGTVLAPASKVDSSRVWTIEWDNTDGCKKISLGGTEIWPNSSAYN